MCSTNTTFFYPNNKSRGFYKLWQLLDHTACNIAKIFKRKQISDSGYLQKCKFKVIHFMSFWNRNILVYNSSSQ